MNILIDKIEPEYRDVSTMEGYDFLVVGHRVEFRVVSGAAKANELLLKGEAKFPQKNLTTNQAENLVKDLIKKVAK